MNRWRVILATVVIFGTGVVTGGLSLRMRDRAGQPHPPASPWMMQRLEFIRRAQHELHLTPDQSSRIEKILSDSRDRMKSIWETVAPQTRQECDQVREQIRAVLTPDQWVQFQELSQQRNGRGAWGHRMDKKERTATRGAPSDGPTAPTGPARSPQTSAPEAAPRPAPEPGQP